MNQRSSRSTEHRRRLTPKQRAKILSAHKRSGLSLLAFARMRGLCYASLLRWRSRLRSETNPANPDPQFVPITLEPQADDTAYVLSWAHGRSLTIPPRFNPDSLHRLLTVLEARP